MFLWREQNDYSVTKKFFYSTSPRNYAIVKNDKLYIYGQLKFESLMYNLTYATFGYTKCRYCGKKLTKDICTLDHITPRALGGISLTNNLCLACRKCNGEKENLTLRQYKFIKKQNPKFRRLIITKFNTENEKLRENGNNFMPPEWITSYDVSYLEKHLNFSKISKRNLKRHEEFYQKTHTFMHPIVISSNGWLLKGRCIIFIAKKYGIDHVPAIVLDNVIVD